ncbi:hypothetical protein NL676_025836 [Syzygium grande]|nr:hypothetical protein NL676_025836 [Syzygium grande]
MTYPRVSSEVGWWVAAGATGSRSRWPSPKQEGGSVQDAELPPADSHVWCGNRTTTTTQVELVLLVVCTQVQFELFFFFFSGVQADHDLVRPEPPR